MNKETSKRLSAGLLASAIALNTVLSISADDGIKYYSAGESGIAGTFTSAPNVAVLTLGASDIELNDGNYIKWIDRVDIPDYAENMYNRISQAAFWTDASNFSDQHRIEEDYQNGTVDNFIGLEILEETKNSPFTSEEKSAVGRACRAAFDALDRDHPEIFWLTGETNIKYLITSSTVDESTTYTLRAYLVLRDDAKDWDMRYEEYQNISALEAAIDDMDKEVAEILDDASGTDYQKIKYFNDYLVTANDYNTVVSGGGSTPEGADEAYRAIFGGKGENGPVCEGYARAFKVLCDKAGIPCVLTDGTANGGPHMWNYAAIDNTWYGVDVTWDDTAGGEKYDKYLMVGADTVISGTAFSDSHTVSNTASFNGVSFINGPELNSDAYVPSEAEGDYVAFIGSTGFVTLKGVVEAANTGNTITLAENVSLEEKLIVDKGVTIDLNGNRITTGESYSITAQAVVTITDSLGGGSVDGTVVFENGGSVTGAAMGKVNASQGTLVFSNSTADLLSVSANASASVSDSAFKDVFAASGIDSILADGQMYYVDSLVKAVSADKLQLTSLTGNITVKEGLAVGVILNNEENPYDTNYTYNGKVIAAPEKDNFIYYGADPSFVWKKGTSKLDSAPSEIGTYTLVVTSGASGMVDSASLELTVTIGQYDSSAVAVLTGEKGNNGWIISDAELQAPDGYQISLDGGVYSDSVSFNSFTNETVSYYLKEIETGNILTGLTVDVKVDMVKPWFITPEENNANIGSVGASIKVKGEDDSVDKSGNPLPLTYSARLSIEGSKEVSNTNGQFSFSKLEPATKYNVIVTVTDQAGNSYEGVVSFTTLQGNLTEKDIRTAPKLTGVYGTAVRDMTITGGVVKYGNTTLEGTWAVTDINGSEIPDVNTTSEYQLTFTPASASYTPVSTSVKPVVSALSISEAYVSGIDSSYTYAGGEVIKPDAANITVTLGGKTLALDTRESKGDYIVEYGSNINSGESKGKVIIRGVNNYNGSVEVPFDILKAENNIVCHAIEEWKTYGDKDFPLSISTNNSETSFVFEVSDTDVVDVSGNNTVKIKGAGEAVINVYQPETQNYKASNHVTVWVIVAKSEEVIDAGEIEETYIYSTESKGEIDVGEYIIGETSGKCGKLVSFTASADKSSVVSNVKISNKGILTFTAGKGNIGDTALIRINAEVQNYEGVTATVVVTLDDKYGTKPKATIAPANNITYGQPLSDISFKTSTFVTTDGKTTVAGTLEWENPDQIPSASEKTANWKFTPDNTEIYKECSGKANITVNQAVPVVTAPVVSSMVYNPDRKLSDVIISGDDGKSVVNGVSVTVTGSWSWAKPTTVPDCKTKEQIALFTPEDIVNYKSVEVKVPVNVTKAQAQIEKEPTATAITYGQKVSQSTLKNGTADTAGKFAWAEGDKLLKAGEHELEVIFTPSDSVNYTGASTTAKLTVNKAKEAPNMPASKINSSFEISTVGGVQLPEYWNWDSADAHKGIEVGSSATATAIYNGLDKGNYEHESVVITVTRSKCSHKKTKLINEKKATCTEKGYTGDTYCSDCDTVTVKGKEIAIVEHTGGKATCNSLAVCTYCKKTYGDYDKEKHSGTKVVRNAIAATEKTAGYTGDVCCSACGFVLEKGVVIPAGSPSVTTANPNIWNDITTTTTKATTTAKSTTTTKNTTTTTAPDDKYNEEAPYIYDNDEKYGWSDIIKDINSAKSGDKIEVDMNYTTALPQKALSALKGKDVDLVLHMDSTFAWIINGKTIKSAKDINMEVIEDSENISVEIIDQVTGDAYSTTLTLTHNGEFGFEAILLYDAGEPGYYANLYYYNPAKKSASFVTSDKIDSDGYAELKFDHASEYIIVIDEKDHSGRAGIEYDGGDDPNYEDDDSDEYEEDDSNHIILDDDMFLDDEDYYTGGEQNPSTAVGLGHAVSVILAVSAFIVRPKKEKRNRKTL